MKKVFSTYALIAGIAIIFCSGCGGDVRDSVSDSESDAICLMPEHCNLETGCLDSVCCAAAAECHEITRYSFNQMAGSDEPGRVYSAAEITAAMRGHGCDSWIHLDRTPATNSSIAFTVERAGACPDKRAVHYTIQFFKGVLQKNPDSLVFFKAVTRNKPNIIFTAVRTLRQVPGQPSIIYYDLSELLPNREPAPDPIRSDSSVNSHRNDN